MSGVAASIAFDLRSTCRALLRHPLFLGPAVLILGLGIGANAAVTGLAWAGAPLPFPVRRWSWRWPRRLSPSSPAW